MQILFLVELPGLFSLLQAVLFLPLASFGGLLRLQAVPPLPQLLTVQRIQHSHSAYPVLIFRLLL